MTDPSSTASSRSRSRIAIGSLMNNGRAFLADSFLSTTAAASGHGTKRKEREFDDEVSTTTTTASGVGMKRKERDSDDAASTTTSATVHRDESDEANFPSTTSGLGTKRKERDSDDAASTTTSATVHRDESDETKIAVVVRYRSKNEREVREDSGAAVDTDGVKGNTVELSMGPNSPSRKAYSFDRVFPPTADQQTIFDEVATPVLDEVLKGFNCTIFAYGQTGTGKTYTMSGDLSDHTPPPDDAGIIPRVLHSLFLKLDRPPHSPTSGAAPENSVKVSFIELYNEEVRDLLSAEDKSNLKIIDGDGERGAATLVQGVEERHITTARKGIQLVRDGRNKRQAAAAKCNDVNSRSHTIFTVTVHTNQTSASGEELVSSGKLNLVDLAGSENIDCSLAEDKSLLTLGCVTNALVARSAHIPYRESKLTQLLQDSLGGQTKTCIIATLSPATSALEDTISTLDYAFHARNIRNTPQMNRLIPKKTLLREFTVEIERLRSELTATRQQNGVHLTYKAYGELLKEYASDGNLIKEQRKRIEKIEDKVARKEQYLLELKSNFDMLKRESEATKGLLGCTNSFLEEALAHSRRMRNDQILLCQQHERAEQRLTSVKRKLETALGHRTTDNTGP